MHSSLSKGRHWEVCAARVRDGALQDLHSSESDNGSDNTEEDEGFGDHHSAIPSQAQSSFLRNGSQHNVLFISEPSDVSSVGEVAAMSPERVQDAVQQSPTQGVLLTPTTDVDASHTSEAPGPEDAPEATPGALTFPDSLPSDRFSPVKAQEIEQDPVLAPSHASRSLFSPFPSQAKPVDLSSTTALEDDGRSRALRNSCNQSVEADVLTKQLAKNNKHAQQLRKEPPEFEVASAKAEHVVSSRCGMSVERDVRSLVAAAALMVGMAMPKGVRLPTFLACFAAIISIVARLAPKVKEFLDENDGKLSSLFSLEQTTRGRSKVPLLHRSVGINGHAQSKVPLLRNGALRDANNVSKKGTTVQDRPMSLGAVGRKLSNSFRQLGRSLSAKSGFDLEALSTRAEGARHRTSLGDSGLKEVDSDQDDEASEDDLHGAVLASLSEEHRLFIASAGEEEKTRLVKQCLAYANGEIEQARKVCNKFCKFRTDNGWTMLLSPVELEKPLRSRTHTLADSRDSEERGILTFTPAKMDMSCCSAAAYQKMLCYVLQEALKDEELQTKGLVLLVDARDVGFGMLKHFKMADYKRGLGMLSGAFPAKLKAIRILHPTRALRVALSIALPLLSAKMRARVEVVGSDDASDGSFVKTLAAPAVVPMEVGIGGTWEGSGSFWNSWVEERVERAM